MLIQWSFENLRETNRAGERNVKFIQILQFIYHRSELIIYQMKSSADMLNYQDTVSYLGAVSFISADSGPYGTCHALHNDKKLTKEAARIICNTIYWTTCSVQFNLW